MHAHAHDVSEILGSWPILWALFMTGLVGGFGHCTAMCGPFVLAQVGGGLAARPLGDGTAVLVRAGRGVLAPYHLGRLTTYAVLGGVMGGVSGMLVRTTEFTGILAAVLAFAAFLFLMQAIKGFARWVPALAVLVPTGPGMGGAVAGRLAGMLRPLFADPSGWNGYGIGLALGFLPCGFLYAALASAVGTGSALGGFAAMGAFALGTMPSLIAVGVLGSVAGSRWIGVLRAATPVLMLANAVIVARMALHAAA